MAEPSSRDDEVPREEGEVGEAVKRSKAGRAVGPDDVPAEFWRLMGVFGIEWFKLLLSKLMRVDPMPNQWRGSYLMPPYKGQSSSCHTR